MSDSSVPKLFQLVARSLCSSNRCIPAGLVSNQGVCEPRWSLIGQVLSKVQMDKAHIVLVAPVWKTQPWYPLLLEMLVAIPRPINHHQIMLNRGPPVPQLVVCHISGRDTNTKSFQRKLLPSCSNHRELRPTSLTTHSLASGITGVVQEV